VRSRQPARVIQWVIAGFCCWSLLAGGQPARANNFSPEHDPLNHAFAVYIGSGLYVAGGRSVFVFRIAPLTTLRSEEKHKLGIRLRINATFGFYDLKPEDFLNFELPDRIATIALVPGVEFPIKLYDNWTLMPFIDAGAATDSEFHDVTMVVGTGARSRAEFHDKRHLYVLWNVFVYANNIDDDEFDRQDYTVFRTDFEMRKLVTFKMFKRDLDMGLLAKSDWFFDTVLIDVPLGEPVKIRKRFELGLTIGSTRKYVFKKMLTAPRFGVTYITGDGVSGVRFVLRFRN
jgi:hypothetical protein